MGILPEGAAIIWLVGAVLLDIHDEWQVADRAYFSDASMALINSTDTTEEGPAELDAAQAAATTNGPCRFHHSMRLCRSPPHDDD